MLHTVFQGNLADFDMTPRLVLAAVILGILAKLEVVSQNNIPLGCFSMVLIVLDRVMHVSDSQTLHTLHTFMTYI